MSLQWPETLMNIGLGTLYGSELRVLVQPNAIELCLLKRDFMHGFKAQIVKRQQIAAPETGTAQALSSELLQKLTNALQHRDWHGAAPTVVLSNAFVRYGMLAWNADIKTKPEHKAYLQHTFAQHFGEQTKAWHLRAHDAGYGKTTIASGIERALIEQLQAAFKAANMPLKAVHPLLMMAINLALLQLKKRKLAQNFWLVCSENKRLTLALVENGDWKRVWNLPAEAPLEAQISALMQREAVLNNMSDTLPVLQFTLQDILLEQAGAIKQQAEMHAKHADGFALRRKLA